MREINRKCPKRGFVFMEVIAQPLLHLNEFFKAAEKTLLTANDQAFYVYLFYRFNKAYWKETLTLTDQELYQALRFYDNSGKPASKNIIRRIRSRLKLKGFIDYSSGKGDSGTIYRLVPLGNFENDAGQYSEPKILDDRIFYAWIRTNNSTPCEGDRDDLIYRQQKFGVLKVVEAIESCRRKKLYGDFININFLDYELNANGEKNGKNLRIPDNGAKKRESVNTWGTNRRPPNID